MIDSTTAARQGVGPPAATRGDPVAPGADAKPSAQAITAPPEVQPPSAIPEAEPGGDTAELLESLSQRLNEFVQENTRELEFRVDDDGGRVVILVRQSETGELLRTIPPEEALGLVGSLDEGAAALFSQLA